MYWLFSETVGFGYIRLHSFCVALSILVLTHIYNRDLYSATADPLLVTMLNGSLTVTVRAAGC